MSDKSKKTTKKNPMAQVHDQRKGEAGLSEHNLPSAQWRKRHDPPNRSLLSAHLCVAVLYELCDSPRDEKVVLSSRKQLSLEISKCPNSCHSNYS